MATASKNFSRTPSAAVSTATPREGRQRDRSAKSAPPSRSPAPPRTPAKGTDRPRPVETLRGAYEEIPLDLIDAHPDNPREHWEGQGIQEMVPSIHQVGILQAIIVRRFGDRFQLVAGERRYRAAKRAHLKSIPAIVRKLSDSEALTQMLVENLQRRNLNAIEKAKALAKLCAPVNEGGAGKSHTDAAALFGRKRSWTSNLIRLLRLPDSLQRRVADGKLAERLARKLVMHVESPELLAAVELDMEANPWAWGTSEAFERSLGIIAANPASAGKMQAEPPRPSAPRNPPAPIVVLDAATEAVAASVAQRTPEPPTAGAAAPSDVETICAAIGRLSVLAEIEIVQAALAARRAALSPSPSPTRRKS